MAVRVEHSVQMTETGRITLVPSVHVSTRHRRRVRETIREANPDLVAVELDERRFERLERGAQQELWALARDMPPASSVTYAALQSIQRTVVRLSGLDPGETDMVAGIETAAELDTEIALIDEPIEDIFADLATRVGLSTIPKLLLGSQVMGLDDPAQPLEQLPSIHEIESGDDVQPLIEQMERCVPEIKEVLIDQRDRAMAHRLHQLRRSGHHVVAVIGVGHHNGIQRILAELDREDTAPDIDVPVHATARDVTRIPIT